MLLIARRKVILVAGLILFSLLTGCHDTTATNSLRPDAVILAFGNSLTYGTGAKENENYPAQLQRLISRQVINAGVPGEVTAQGRTRLPALLDEHQPDLLILCHGGNDMLRRLDREQTVANLKAMIEEAQGRKIPVILLSVPQLGLFIDSAPFYSEIAETYNIPCEDDIISDVLADRNLKSDTIHPNATGYRMMAESVADLLKKNGII